MKKYIILNNILVFVLLWVSNAIAQDDRRNIKIGTGSVAGLYYTTGSALCKIYNTYRSNDKAKCSALLSYGSADNIENLKAGLLNFALTQTEILKEIYQKKEVAESDNISNSDIRAVFSLHPETLAIIVQEDSNINRISDIKNKKINICNPGSGTRKVVDKFLAHLNYSYKDFARVSQSNIYQQAEDLCQGKIDIATYFVGNPNAAMKEIIGLCKIKILSFSDEEIDFFIKSYPEYSKEKIPASIYSINNQDVNTFGSEAILITTKDTDKTIVYEFVKKIFEHFEEFKKLHPALNILEPQEMIKEQSLTPFHEGALKFYKELGFR